MTLEEFKQALETKKKQAMIDLNAKEIEYNRWADTNDCSALANEISELKGTIMAYTDAIVLLSYVRE